MCSRAIKVLAILLLISPNFVWALCTNTGATVVYVNGIFTTLVDAQDNLFKLQTKFFENGGSREVQFRNGYNPSHLSGLGDLTESVTQAFSKPVSDYDLDTILMQIHPEVTTRKILLLGHSQGSFYTDEMYQYLVAHGVPKESIAVYNVATPESFVGGGGGYLTSTNDKVINAVRDAEVNGNLQVYLNSYYVHTSNVVNSALRANVTVPKEPDWDSDLHGGHYFSLYLDGAADRIVHDIDGELGALKAEGTAGSPDGCFTPPPPTLAYEAEAALLAVSDPLVGGTFSAGMAVENGALALAQGTFGAFASGATALQSALGLGSNLGQAAAAALPLDGQLQLQSGSASQPPVPAARTPSQPPQTSSVQNDVPPPSQSTPPSGVVPPTAQISISPGFGGGGGGTDSASVQDSQQGQSGSGSPQNQNVPVVALSVTAPSDGAFVATTSVVFTGATDAGNLVTATFGASSASTSADGAGNWSLPLSIPEGSIQVDVSASDSAGHNSPTVSREVTVDLTPPATTTPSVAACDATLLAGGCLVPTTTVDIAWTSVADASYYALVKNGIAGATTTALTSQAIIVAGATTTLSVVAYDAAGNAATSTEVDVAAITQPLIINEIGWGGTDTDPTNQWIEIKNNTSFDLDLSHIALTRSGGAAVALSGILPATINQNFLVIAPGSPNFFGAHVLTSLFPALATATAEQLSLVWNDSKTLDATPPAAACTGWCAGSYHATLGSNVSGLSDLTSPLSMERKTNTDGTLASSWQNTDSYGPWTGGGANADVWGTPGVENSAGLPDAGVYCGSKTNLLVQSAPPGPPFNPGTDGCTYLARFITGSTFGAVRYGGMFEGDVSNGTGGADSMGKALGLTILGGVPSGTAAGTHFFFAIWELRSFANDGVDFSTFFTDGSIPAPHGNYVTIPFTYTP